MHKSEEGQGVGGKGGLGHQANLQRSYRDELKYGGTQGGHYTTPKELLPFQGGLWKLVWLDRSDGDIKETDRG